MDSLFDFALAAFVAISAMSNFFGLPGNLIMASGSLFYGVTTGFNHMSLTFFLTIFLVVLIFEGLEFLLLAFTAKKYGSSKWGILGAVVGGVAGGYAGYFISPVAGAIVGSVIGLFLGTSLIAFIKEPRFRNSIRSGYGAFMGKIGGLSVKVIGSMTIASMIITRLI